MTWTYSQQSGLPLTLPLCGIAAMDPSLGTGTRGISAPAVPGVCS